MVLSLAVVGADRVAASLESYDTVIAGDVPAPLRTLTIAETFNGSNRASFDFGPTSGDVTMEFILEGDPTASGGSAYLAVGANATSNLRYAQWNNTGQMGFTQLGVADYLFFPAVPSPNVPVHVAYVWDASAATMTLYLNGSVAGSRSGVTGSFAMPSGQGYLGANPSGTETMVGTVYRVTVYDELLPDETILRHADAYNDVVRLPVIVSFEATPEAIFTPESSTLSWNVADADGVFVNGMDVTGASSLEVAPVVTTVYTLTATNEGGAVMAEARVEVNPSPVIDRFGVSRRYVGAGETVTFSWETRYGTSFGIVPGPGDVGSQTTDGAGAVAVQVDAAARYVLTVGNAFGTATAEVEISIVNPADHLVISEFMADNESTLVDEDGEFSDWVEIYNPTAAAVDLAGHYLTDDAGDPERWAFPSVVVPAGGYLLVFASGKDRRVAGSELHANFALERNGEYLALVGPGPVLLHAFSPLYPAQRADISHGILGGDVAIAIAMGVPTPGAVNDETIPPPAKVEFSVGSGFFTNGFQVELTTASAEATIRYTTDGSKPGAEQGILYEGPVLVTGTTRLRAVAVEEGRVSEVTGERYVELGVDVREYASTLPIMVIDNFGAGVIPQKGWSGTGAGIRQLRRQDAVWATFEKVDGMSSMTNAPEMMSAIGIRGRGAFSTQWRQKPYSVEAVNERNEERDVSPLGLPAHSDWVLYFPDPDSNKDPSLLFNTFAYELSGNTGRYSVRFRWVELFVNENGGALELGDRRGVYAIIEKVSRGARRLDFERLSEDGTTGGWLLGLNRMDAEPEGGWPAPNGATQPWFFHTAGPNRIQETPPNTPSQGDDIPRQSNGYLNFDNPNGYRIDAAQRAAIEGWFREFEDVLYNNAVWRDPVNGYRKYLDPLDFADYFVLNVLTRNGDGLLISMFPWKGDDGRLRMGPAWDYNWNAYYISGGPTGSLMHRSDRLWYPRLFSDPDFAQLYIDRWWELRAGPLSNAAMEAVIDGQVADISPAKALLNGLPSEADWAGRISDMKSWLTQRADWIDSNYLRPPVFNNEGGAVPEGFQVVVSGTNGTVYVAIDGSDPRAPGGGVSPSAQVYSGPIPILGPTMVKARVWNGSQWSGLVSGLFYPPHEITGLAVTEIMYDPAEGSDLEFLELKNVGSEAIDLGNLFFSDGIDFVFPNGTMLGPGGFVVLVRNALAFGARYPGVPIDGVYGGGLDNGGETIRLRTPRGDTVVSVVFDDRAPWPITADGFGYSLVPREAMGPINSSNGSDWRGSAVAGGSPGMDDPDPGIPPVVVNELLTHTDPPVVDAVELYNPTGAEVDLSGWFLSDDAGVPMKFRVPAGTTIAGFGYRVFTEANFNPEPGTLLNFSLDSAGDALYLSSGGAMTNLTGYSHGVSFEAAANGVTFGRYVNSVGEEQFPAQLAETLGGVNSGPVVGPVVLSEIHYHPVPGEDEFVELKNISGSPVPLFDPEHETNRWRINGLGYEFPAGTTLEADEVMVVTGGDPGQFRVRHAVPEGVRVLGPFGGALQNDGERLALQRPDAPDTNGVPYITVDAVRYDDVPLWPVAADGSGASLQRMVLTEYGDDPMNWKAALPTPGGGLPTGELPVVLVGPENRTIVAYQTATFEVQASGPGLRYQWLYQGGVIEGAMAASLTLERVRPDQIGEYSVVIYNAFGSVVSAAAELTTLLPALILQQPEAVKVIEGGAASFTVGAIGTGPLSYQWQFNGADLEGETGVTLTLTGVGAGEDGEYAVVITDDVGPITSEPARLTVLIAPSVVVAPVGGTYYEGEIVTLSIETAGTLPMGYRWRRGGTTVRLAVLNSHVDFLTLTDVQAGDAGSYSVVLTNEAFYLPGRLSPRADVVVAAWVDSDGDGLPDDYEQANGLNPLDGGDAQEDSDQDGVNALDEYRAGTDPQDPLSVLKAVLDLETGQRVVRFFAVAGKTYEVQYRDRAGTGQWQMLTGVPARAVSEMVEVIDAASPMPAQRYYRLATPYGEE